MIAVPLVVASKALAVGAARWLGELPALVASLEREWSIAVGRPYDDATKAFVAEATLDDGTRAVLKVLVPRAGDAARNEITVLRLTNGEGCVRLAGRRGAGCPGPRAAWPLAARACSPHWAEAGDSLLYGRANVAPVARLWSAYRY